MTLSPGLKYTAATASWQCRRERGQQIKSCGVACFLSFTPTALGLSYLSVTLAFFQICCFIFPCVQLGFTQTLVQKTDHFNILGSKQTPSLLDDHLFKS